jgi:N-acetylglucosaminyldiphosphoundecaprenol N-acetyl-beta-D-mannosaminyltransferase
MKPSDHRPAAQVLGVDVDALNMDTALLQVNALLHGAGKDYICVTSVHGIMEAQRNPELLDIYANSGMTIPDGMPLVWVGRTQGHREIQRVTGPDLMIEIFRRRRFAHVTHFLYGGREGIAEELRDELTRRFPWVNIVGTYTPPFRDLNDSEVERFVATIATLKPDIIWVGISCPRQEIFMARHLPALETKLMFGVGAAFDYHTGHIRDCAEWIKRAGLQWLHRLLQDPRRLWRRYLRNNPAFVCRIALQMLLLRQHPQKSSMRTEARHRAPTQQRSAAATATKVRPARP